MPSNELPEQSKDNAEHLDAEKTIKRNPHPDFKKVEGSRPDFPSHPAPSTFTFTKVPSPSWTYGSGGNDDGASLSHNHISIDPYAEGRQPVQNYKLLISGIVPRPIGFLSTRSKDGSSTNLAPFSYTQVISHDPPIFIVGFASSLEKAKDTLKNLVESKECVINIISEHFLEAANATSIDAPYGVSEWAVSGLTPTDCETVKATRVKEAVFSVEGHLMDTKEFKSPATGRVTATMAIIQGTRFWVREDAIDETKSLIDPGVLRPMSRLGGITYGRTVEGVEIPRPVWENVKKEQGEKTEALARPKVDGQ
ncbi:MAG: hypothetical protein Q9227_007369 [Pyrenula ochraceoflavens]